MEKQILANVKSAGMESVYILAGALAVSYAKGLVTKYTEFKYMDEALTLASIVGVAYFKNSTIKNIMKGGAVAGILGLAKKYFGLGVL